MGYGFFMNDAKVCSVFLSREEVSQGSTTWRKNEITVYLFKYISVCMVFVIRSIALIFCEK